MKNNVKGIHLNWIIVKDVEAAIKYYTEVLGLNLHHFSKEHGWAELSGNEGSVLGIAQENQKFGKKAGTNAVITITVEDINKAREELLKKKAKIVGEILEVPGHVKLQTLEDADGNMLQLAQKLD